MIFKEENILFPMALQTLTEDEWVKMAHESDEIGYCLTGPAGIWKPERKAIQLKKRCQKDSSGWKQEFYLYNN